MVLVLLISCFLWSLTNGQGQPQCRDPARVTENCFQFTCPRQASEACAVENFFDADSGTCRPYTELPLTFENYDSCRCGNTVQQGLIEGSRNGRNEYLYCTESRGFNRYTCETIPATLTKPADCPASTLCATGAPTPVANNCNAYNCGTNQQACPANEFFNARSGSCDAFSSYVNANANEFDSCLCASLKRTGLVEGRRNTNNQHLYCTTTGARRYRCEEIPTTETKPAECQAQSTSLCRNGEVAMRTVNNCASYRCGFDAEVYFCPRGKYFAAETKTCETVTASLSNQCICNAYQFNTLALVRISANRLIQCNPRLPQENGVTISCPGSTLCQCVETNDARIADGNSAYVQCSKLDDRIWIVERGSCPRGLVFNDELSSCQSCRVENYEYKAHPCDRNAYLFVTVQRCPLGKIWNDSRKSCV